MPEIPDDQKMATRTGDLPFRIVSQASVTLIAKTTYLDHEVDKWCRARGFVYDTDAFHDADALCEFAGRTCYLSFNEDRRRPAPEGEQNSLYLDNIKSVGHKSIMEHPTWTFLIDDFSKGTTQELVRHRVGVAYSIQSSRYVDQFDDCYFGNSGHKLGVYVPQEIQDDENLFQIWVDQWKATVEIYKETFRSLVSKGLDKKTARSIARGIIPNDMCNAIVFSVNARELDHIFAVRGSVHAHPEFRKMVLRIWDYVREHNLFSHWKVREHKEHGRYLTAG